MTFGSILSTVLAYSWAIIATVGILCLIRRRAPKSGANELLDSMKQAEASKTRKYFNRVLFR